MTKRPTEKLPPPSAPVSSKGGTERMRDTTQKLPPGPVLPTERMSPTPPPPTTVSVPPSHAALRAYEYTPTPSHAQFPLQIAATQPSEEPGPTRAEGARTVVGGNNVSDQGEAPIDRISVGQRVGHFVLRRPLGSGSYGQVFEAYDDRLPELKVAVKIIPVKNQSMAETKKELAMIALVNHPNLVSLLDHGMCTLETETSLPQQVAWFAMPFYKGSTLSERVARGNVDLKTLVRWFKALASAVKALHSARIRHQDIKPDNIFIANFSGDAEPGQDSEYEIPVLLDLGVAIGADDQNFFAGTLEFWAPEQERAFQRYWGKIAPPTSLPLGPRMDVYSLALSLFHALGAKDAFDRCFATLKDGKMQRDVASADAYNARLADDPLLAKVPRQKRAILPEFFGAPRAKLAEGVKSWFTVDPQNRASIDEFSSDLDLLFGMERFKAAIKRALTYAGSVVALALIAGGGAYKKYTDTVLENDLKIHAMGVDFEKCLSKSGSAKLEYTKTLSTLESCTKDLSSRQQTLDDSQGKLGDSLKKLSDCETLRTNLNGKANKLSHDLEAQKAEFIALQQQDGIVRQSLALCTTQKDAAEARAADLQQRLASSQAETAAARAELTSCRQIANSTQNSLNACAGNLAACSNTSQACASNLAGCENTRAGLAANFAACQGHLASAVPRGQLQQCEQALQACRSQAPGQPRPF